MFRNVLQSNVKPFALALCIKMDRKSFHRWCLDQSMWPMALSSLLKSSLTFHGTVTAFARLVLTPASLRLSRAQS